MLVKNTTIQKIKVGLTGFLGTLNQSGSDENELVS
jgi:hypothetical protein